MADPTHYIEVTIDPDGDPDSRRRELGLSPETHICMRSTQTSASVSTWSPWREVPDADA